MSVKSIVDPTYEPSSVFVMTEFNVHWAYGDGSGGPEENIGKVSGPAQCVERCMNRRKNGKVANGVTVDAATQKSCYCEYGQTGRTSSRSWKNTYIPRRNNLYYNINLKPNVNGIYELRK